MLGWPKMNSALGAILAASLWVAGPLFAHGDLGPGLDPLPKEDFSLSDARHLLFRAGFGGTPEEVQRLHRLGLERMVSWLVDYERKPDLIGPLNIQPLPPLDYRAFRKLDEMERRKIRGERRRMDAIRVYNLLSWWGDRMLRTRRPLEEKMTLFWHGHFTSSQRDVRNGYRMYLQNQTLRENATGNFRDLLHAISKDPAMLEYLDNNRNRRGRPNENFAREVMELFTLGIGNYTEDDIKEAARAFTGWTFNGNTSAFVFQMRQHDYGEKTFLGRKGNFDGDDILEILLEQKSCAPYIAKKIFSYFAYENPDPALVENLGEYLRACNYEIKPLLRRIFLSRAFYSKQAKGTQVKSPVMFVVSTIRMMGMNPPPGGIVAATANPLGQRLMDPPNVKGWERGLSWITTANLLNRNNVVGQLMKLEFGKMPKPSKGRMRAGRGRLRREIYAWDPGWSARGIAEAIGAQRIPELVDGMAARFLLVPLSPVSRDRLIRLLREKNGGDALDWNKLKGPATEKAFREFLHLLMSVPEFQVC
jgi:hypothetical protein